MAKAKKKVGPVVKAERWFLEEPRHSNSYISVEPYRRGESFSDAAGFSLELGDCNRRIAWEFPNDDRGRRKIDKLKKLFDRLYEGLHKDVVE